MLKDLVRYGANFAQEGDRSNEWVDAAVDAAAATLGAMAPEFLPVINALRETLKPNAKQSVNSMIDQLSKWSVNGLPSLTCSQSIE